MTVRRTTFAVLLPVVVIAGLVGVASAHVAASGVPVGAPAAIRTAFAHGPGPWKVPVDQATGNSKMGTWPDACLMLNLAELKAVLPGTSSFKTRGTHEQFYGGTETPKLGDCRYDLKGSYDPPPDGGPASSVEVSLNGVADAAAVKAQWAANWQSHAAAAKKYPGTFAVYKIGSQGQVCSWDQVALECIAGTWSFDVHGLFFDKNNGDGTALEQAFMKNDLLPIAAGLAGRMK